MQATSHPLRPGAPLRAALGVLALALALVLPGCVRGPGDPQIPAPAGYLPTGDLDRLRALVSEPALAFPSEEEYRIGPGDVISVRMIDRPDLFGDTPSDGRGRYIISRSKALTFPMIGAVVVHGKTAAELQGLLTSAYQGFFVDPVIAVTIEEYYQNQITVAGSVRTPGRFELTGGETILDAIYKAGGLTFGGRTGGLAPAPFIILYRERLAQEERLLRTPAELEELLREPSGMIRARDEYRIPISDFLTSGRLTYNIPLRPNDVIYMVPAGSVNFMGRVRNPGVVFLGPSIQTLAQAVNERGGLRYGAASRVEVVRPDAQGNPVSTFVNVRAIMSRKEPDFLLRDGDQIHVFTHQGRAALETLGNILRAGTRAGVQATYNPVGA